MAQAHDSCATLNPISADERNVSAAKLSSAAVFSLVLNGSEIVLLCLHTCVSQE